MPVISYPTTNIKLFLHSKYVLPHAYTTIILFAGMNHNEDTIAAISTAAGEAGISIVRISGTRSLEIADTIFRGTSKTPSTLPGKTFAHGYIKSANQDDDIDEVIMLIYKAPESYTCEDVVEIQGHGGRACGKRILRATLDAGARPAEPGEFTKRAFLNGRIDLLQAEAVADLISATSDRAATAAVQQLEGSLSSSITTIYDDLMNCAADLEATLDFSEEDLPETTMKDIAKHMQNVKLNMDTIMESWEEGQFLREGALAVISGKPNVGKSTLLNQLLGADRAIVTDIPGTTRDTIEEQIIIDGIPIRLVDTAGLRSTDCDIEQQGIKRAKDLIEKADINLHVLDSSQDLPDNQLNEIESLNENKCILILNKQDLAKSDLNSNLSNFTQIKCSLLNNAKVPTIQKAIINKLGIETSLPPQATISERHRQIILNVLNDISESIDLLNSDRNDMVVLASAATRSALLKLGTITGRTYDTELLDNIFQRFCIGK